MNALVAALLLAALPYPAPRLALVTEDTKYDPGVVVSVDVAKAELRVRCASGIVTFKVAADLPVLDAAGKSLGGPAGLKAGQKVGVWYLIDHGARAIEIAVEVGARTPP